jgi:hypothetical protein
MGIVLIEIVTVNLHCLLFFGSGTVLPVARVVLCQHNYICSYRLTAKHMISRSYNYS